MQAWDEDRALIRYFLYILYTLIIVTYAVFRYGGIKTTSIIEYGKYIWNVNRCWLLWIIATLAWDMYTMSKDFDLYLFYFLTCVRYLKRIKKKCGRASFESLQYLSVYSTLIYVVICFFFVIGVLGKYWLEQNSFIDILQSNENAIKMHTKWIYNYCSSWLAVLGWLNTN